MCRRPLLILLIAIAGLVATSATSPANAQSGANVLVVANEAVDAGTKIAEYYSRRRSIPAEQILRVRTAASEDISRPAYERQIERPIADWIAKNSAHDRILYIVLTKGVPLKITGTIGRNGAAASVDSELTLLYRRMAGIAVAAGGSIRNPYFAGDSPVRAAAPFSHAEHDIYLVTRLDGFTTEDVLALIDRGVEPRKDGRVLLDQRGGGSSKPADNWLAAAAERLKTHVGDRIVLETTKAALTDQDDVLGYSSWGSNDPALAMRHPNLRFLPGALATMFVSSDARTFVEPPANWRPSTSEARQRSYAGSSQSLVADFVRAGVTGIGGQVAEPLLGAAIRPDILLPAYVAGANLAEAFYRATPSLSWQTVILGDPLCAPFRSGGLADNELAPSVDPETELPRHFSARRLAASGLASTNQAAARLLLRTEARLARSDRDGARELLEKALALEPGFPPALRALATLHEVAGTHEKAIAIYRELVEKSPKDVFALNNLAYALATRQNQPREALPLAERALSLAPANAVIVDTLGWIKHLLGEHTAAAELLEAAVKAAPEHPEIRLHAAAVYSSLGRLDDAARELAAAEALDPSIKERQEFLSIREGLKAKPPEGDGAF